MEITIRYELGHSYQEKWTKTDYYCPHCGQQFVWNEEGPGDYYVGTSHLCINCTGSFYLPNSPGENVNWQVKQRIEQLKSAS